MRIANIFFLVTYVFGFPTKLNCERTPFSVGSRYALLGVYVYIEDVIYSSYTHFI